MINKIIEALKSEGIEKYLINKEVKHSCELFFIKKALDARRLKDVTDYTVTVYQDVENDGEKLRGSATVNIHPTMTEKELKEKLRSAYYAAHFAANPFYELVLGSGETICDNRIAPQDINKTAADMVKALYSADNDPDAFINSAEFFSTNIEVRIINSDGVDVSFNEFVLKGEFVTQCKIDEDVELYYSFDYDKPDTEALKEKAAAAIKSAKERSVAKRALKGGNYDVIISGENLAKVIRYYIDKANASFIYPKYSDYSVGKAVQGENVSGEKLNLTCIATEPYSYEGIKMSDLKLVENGILKAIIGPNRFSKYLGITPTGDYRKLRLDVGGESLENMKKKPYLQVEAFSDFQIDLFTGHFGGEIRLAYLYDGEKLTAVTGGSINGDISEAHKSFVFSSERYSDSAYEGPLSVRIENIAVNGS